LIRNGSAGYFFMKLSSKGFIWRKYSIYESIVDNIGHFFAMDSYDTDIFLYIAARSVVCFVQNTAEARLAGSHI